MKRPCLLDSSFLIDLLNEAADGVPGPAFDWLRRHHTVQIWISPVTCSEVMEGAADADAARAQLRRCSWQGIQHAHAERAAFLQRRARHRLGENDAWQIAVVLQMDRCVVGACGPKVGRVCPAERDRPARAFSEESRES